jgi:hypothetical protein
LRGGTGFNRTRGAGWQAGGAGDASFFGSEEVAFLKKSSAKNFFAPQAIAAPKPVPSGQKFFAELFYKKATSFLESHHA